MAKLNTSVNNIQLKSNKVDADLPSSDWTIEQYPSARSLYNVYNLLYPVDSVLCMATNTNPATVLGIGTWELIDKEFKSHWIDISSGTGWTDINGTATTSSGCMLAGHTLSLRLLSVLKTESGDTANHLGTLNPAFVGLIEFPMVKENIPFTIDAGEVVGNASITKAGLVQINDGWTVSDGAIAHTINTEYEVPIYADYAVHYTKMLDSFCNKFYFKRVS